MTTVAKRVLFLLTLGLALGWGHYAAAQAGPIEFSATAAALTGTVTCPDGTVTTLTPVDPSTTSISGSNEAKLTSATVSACGKTIYGATNIDDKTDASDTTTLDDADGQNIASNVKFLGSLVTAATENAPANCTAQGSANVHCHGTGRFTNVAIGGSPIASGVYAGGTTFNIVKAQILSPTCSGVELFTGKLVLADSTITNNHTTHPSAEVDWLHITGQSLCVLTGAVTKYDLRDAVDFQINIILLTATFSLEVPPQ
jgi:hypothetical protein